MIKHRLWDRRIKRLLRERRRPAFPPASVLVLTDNPDIPSGKFLRDLTRITGIEKSEIEVIFVDDEDHPRFFSIRPAQIGWSGRMKDTNILKLLHKHGLLLINLINGDDPFRRLVAAHAVNAFHICNKENEACCDWMILTDRGNENQFLNELEKYWKSMI